MSKLFGGDNGVKIVYEYRTQMRKEDANSECQKATNEEYSASHDIRRRKLSQLAEAARAKVDNGRVVGRRD